MREAEQLKLGGYVQNLPDGSVEVVCQGPETSLEALEAHLKRGPSHARVDDVARVQVFGDVELPRSFDIR